MSNSEFAIQQKKSVIDELVGKADAPPVPRGSVRTTMRMVAIVADASMIRSPRKGRPAD